MSRTFGTSAVQLAGLAGRMLGWRPQEFWLSTPAELAAILAPSTETPAAPSRAQINALMEADDA